MPEKPPIRHVPKSAITAFIDHGRIERLLAAWIPEAQDRAFVARCMLDEGPAHHRGANFVLLALLGELASRLAVAGALQPSPGEERVPVPMRLPPHLAGSVEDGVYPLQFPRKVLDVLTPDEPARQAMIACLVDGPPQHSLANAAMLCLLSTLLDSAGGTAR